MAQDIDIDHVELIPVPLQPAEVGAPGRDWRFYKARRGDGVCWAVVHDGLTGHAGPVRWENEFTGTDFTTVAQQLEGWVRAAAANPRN